MTDIKPVNVPDAVRAKIPGAAEAAAAEAASGQTFGRRPADRLIVQSDI